MNSTFDIRLENEVRDAAYIHLRNLGRINNPPAFTKKGKAELVDKYTPLAKESKKELIKLLKLNYPEFIGRFVNVHSESHVHENNEYYVSVTRIGFEDEAVEGAVNEI